MPELAQQNPNPVPQAPITPPAPSLNQSVQSPLQQGLGLPPSFGSDVNTLTGMIGGAPVSAYQQAAKAEGDVLKAQQKQKVAEAETADQAITKYGSTANEALKRYQTQMAGAPLPAFVPTQETATDIASLGGMVAILGFLVGKGKGMAPGLDALDSMTGMLNGWQQGRDDLYKRKYLEFKANFSRLEEVHQEYMQQLQNSLDIAKVDLQQGVADAKLAAVKAGDEVTAKQIDALGIKAVVDAINTQNGVKMSAAKIIADLDSKQMARLEQMGTPESQAQIATAIANYQMAMPSGFALRSPFWQGVMAQVYQMNPKYSAVNYNKINKAVTAFAVGKQGDVVRSLNVAAYHLQVFHELALALKNGDVRAFNIIGQEYSRQTGLPAPTTFDAAKQIISNEVLKATGGSIGGVTDRKDLQDDLDRANSPDALLGVSNTLTSLIAGQFRGFKRQYESSTGLKFEDSGLIDPQIAKLYQNIISGTQHNEAYHVGQIIEAGGKKYRVTGGDLNGDPDIELMQ